MCFYTYVCVQAWTRKGVLNVLRQIDVFIWMLTGSALDFTGQWQSCSQQRATKQLSCYQLICGVTLSHPTFDCFEMDGYKCFLRKTHIHTS